MATMSKRRSSSRVRREIVEMANDLHEGGLMSRAKLDKITFRMLGAKQRKKIIPLTPAEIRDVRERAGLSQAVFAHYLNLTVSYVSQLERGDKQPSGATAKLLDVVRRKGIEAIL